MIYTHLEIWNHGGNIWHALSCPGTRDLSMGVLKSFEVDRIISWAKSHRMTIKDGRGA